MSRQSLMISCALGATTAFWGLAAAAQPNNPPPSDGPVTTVEETIVTAEGRAVSVQDIPIAVSAYTSQQRDRVGILSIGDLTNFTPGFAYSSSTDRPSIRGISRLTNNFAVDNGVSTYSDGVWTNSTLAAASTPLMVERTEILRGPQGTLYGRNSIGGAINVLSRRPTREMYAEVRATVANYNYMNLQAAISGPLTDNIGFRALALYTNQRDGYYTNVANGRTEGGRGDNY
jgi:iron complex outermembrane receptor protein